MRDKHERSKKVRAVEWFAGSRLARAACNRTCVHVHATDLSVQEGNMLHDIVSNKLSY